MTGPRSLPLVALALVALIAVVVGAGCDPMTITPDLDAGVTRDAGTDAGTDAGETGEALCQENLPIGPPCCGPNGNRLMASECGDEGWTCDEGALCTCGDEPASFICSDACGSDAFADPECVNGEWSCGGLLRSDSCGDDECWGMPGDCCVNPTCVDGKWQCESISC